MPTRITANFESWPGIPGWVFADQFSERLLLQTGVFYNREHSIVNEKQLVYQYDGQKLFFTIKNPKIQKSKSPKSPNPKVMIMYWVFQSTHFDFDLNLFFKIYIGIHSQRLYSDQKRGRLWWDHMDPISCPRTPSGDSNITWEYHDIIAVKAVWSFLSMIVARKARVGTWQEASDHTGFKITRKVGKPFFF